MQRIKIGQLLNRIKEGIILEDNIAYKRVTVRTRNQGVSLRDVEIGAKIGTKKQFLVRKGQFLLSKIDARNGAFGIVSEELDKAIITGNFWTFEVNKELLSIEWFNIFVSSSQFIDICSKASSGTTNRQYLDEKKFLDFEIQLPSLDEQAKFIEQYKSIKAKYESVTRELLIQQRNANNLREAILREAIQGKLVPQDKNDKPASSLLKKIKIEKEKLIKEKRIKKEKPLPHITDEEKLIDLPSGWEWVRLGEVTNILRGSSPRPKGDKRYFSESETDYNWITISDITNFSNNNILYKTREYLTLEGSTKSTYVEKNEVIIAVSGSTTGKSCLTGINGYIYDGLAVIRLFCSEINDRYLLLFMKYLYNYLNNSKEGSAFPNINTDKLKKIVFPLPPLNEQKKIVEKVNQFMTLCDELEKNIKQSKQESENLMKAILQEAFAVKDVVLN